MLTPRRDAHATRLRLSARRRSGPKTRSCSSCARSAVSTCSPISHRATPSTSACRIQDPVRRHSDPIRSECADVAAGLAPAPVDAQCAVVVLVLRRRPGVTSAADSQAGLSGWSPATRLPDELSEITGGGVAPECLIEAIARPVSQCPWHSSFPRSLASASRSALIRSSIERSFSSSSTC